MKERIIYLVCYTLIAMLLIPAGPFTAHYISHGVALADDVQEVVYQEPKLVIGRNESLPTFTAGEEGTLLVPVENLGYGIAKNVNVTLLCEDQANFPFEIENMSLQRRMSTIGARDTEMARFARLKVAKGAKSKTYPLSIRVDYSSENDREGSATGTIFVKIANDRQADLRVTDLFLDEGTLESGVTTEIGLQIKNDGDYAAKDVEVKLTGFTSSGLRLDQPLDTLYITEIKGREFKTLPFKIYADPDIESGTYALDVNLKYRDEADVELDATKKVYLTVDGGDSAGSTKAVPRLIIANYNFGRNYLSPGESFELYLSFLNTSQHKDIYNIKISLSSDDNVFSPIGSGSSIVVEQIPKGLAYEHVFYLKSKLDASSKTYNITASLEYEDQKGNKYSEKEVVGIPLMLEGRLMVPIVEKPDEAFAGSPFGLYVTYFNTGRAAIRNLVIQTEGDFDIRDGDEFVGNLEAGVSDYFEVTLTPRHEGNCKGSLLFSYQDEMGQPYEFQKDFEIEAMALPEPPPMEGPEMGVESRPSKWKIALGIALVLVVGSTAFVVRRRKRQKQLEDVNLDA